MKNIKFITLTLSISLSLFSLKSFAMKESKSPVLKEHIVLRNAYAMSDSCEDETLLKINWRRVLEIVGADLAGAVGGVIAGSVPGAIIGGAAGSIAAGTETSAPQEGTGGIANFEMNALDYSGEQHIKLLNKVMNNRDLAFDSRGFNSQKFMEMAKRDLLAAGVVTAADLNRFSLSDLNTLLTYNSENLSPVAYMNKLKGDGKISGPVATILTTYFETIFGMDNLEELISYSKEIEENIISGDYDRKSKEILLTAMSTARHDIAYWLKNIDRIN